MASREQLWKNAEERITDRDSLDLLRELVATAPTNLEDRVAGRFEKPNFSRAIERVERAAQEIGLATRRFDPCIETAGQPKFPGGPRPNLIIDLNPEAARRVLVLAHYDVVPVPAEQLARWTTPPHELIPRDDGRLYGRGANDDLGSGVVASLLAMKRLHSGPKPTCGVRLIVACDEETGGGGGIEAINRRDAQYPEGAPERFVVGDVALIPDGSPRAIAGSSGVAFLDGTLSNGGTVGKAIRFGQALQSFHSRALKSRSVYSSPDWPDHGAPEPVITGRATVTQVDISTTPPRAGLVWLETVHAESDAANQAPEVVSMVFGGDRSRLSALSSALAGHLRPPFSLKHDGPSALKVPRDSINFQVVGVGHHGGSPHRGHNPVPAALELLDWASANGWLNPGASATARFSLDLRLIPEMPLETGLPQAIRALTGALEEAGLAGTIDAPPDRARGGYSLDPGHPEVIRLEHLIASELKESGVVGEYGGTDASSLQHLRTPAGAPLPAMVFGSMDRESNIHGAEESVDPAKLAGVARVIELFVREP